MSMFDTFQRRGLIRPHGQCWIWRGTTATSGTPIGTIAGETRTIRAFLRAQAGLPMQPGKPVLTTCRNTLCVSPEHSTYSGEHSSLLTRVEELTGKPDANGCLNWIGALDTSGYPVISRRRGSGSRQVIRVVFELRGRKLPPGLQVSHLCENKTCCNPDHLMPATPSMNKLYSLLQADPKTRMTLDRAREWHDTMLRREGWRI